MMNKANLFCGPAIQSDHENVVEDFIGNRTPIT